MSSTILGLCGKATGGTLRELNFVSYRLLDEHCLTVGPLKVTTAKWARKRAHNAFIIGTEIGAREGRPWRDTSEADAKTAPVLQLVR